MSTSVSAETTRRRAPFFIEFYRSAVGKKWVMAITGLLLIGFVIAHLVGTLKIFLGPEASGADEIDEYGHALRELFYPILPRHLFLWIMRVGLLIAFHLACCIWGRAIVKFLAFAAAQAGRHFPA